MLQVQNMEARDSMLYSVLPSSGTVTLLPLLKLAQTRLILLLNQSLLVLCVLILAPTCLLIMIYILIHVCIRRWLYGII
jgi:hypothetical protein